jgi:hypothetical protein
LLTAAASTVSALIGAFTGGWLTRRGEDRKWFREKQIEAYKDLLRHYLSIRIMLNRANQDRSGYDYDWAAWGASSLVARLMAPPAVAAAIYEFHSEVDKYLKDAARDTENDPLSAENLKRIDDRVGAAEDKFLAIVEASMAGKPRKLRSLS